MSEFAQLGVMCPFMVNGETKRRIMTEVVMINEKHVASCLLAKSPLCSTDIKRVNNEERDRCDGV
jgi:hypothetical protein